MRKRILFLVQLPPPVHGVTVVNQKVVGARLLKEAFETRTIPLRFSRSIDDIDKFNFMKILISLRVALNLLWECLFRRPDVVYFTLSTIGGAFFRDLLYVSILKMLGVPRVYHLHRVGIRDLAAKKHLDRLYRWVFKGAWVIHLSHLLYEDVKDYVELEKCFFVANGVDDPFPDGNLDRDYQSEAPFTIAFLSHMVIEKGPILLLQSLAELKRRGKDFRAIFAGGRMSPECKLEFERLVAESSLEECVSYVGPVYGEDKDRFLRSADIFVFPSFYDAFGLVTLEAMSYGLPVIAIKQGSNPDIIQNSVTGFLVEKGNSQVLADKLQVLLEDNDLRKSMGKKGRARFIENFTTEVFEKNLLVALDACLKKAR